MPRRLLLLDLGPTPPSLPPPHPLLLLPLGRGQAAVALDEASAEEVLAELLSRGIAIRASRVILA
jgi:hypothetical protein